MSAKPTRAAADERIERYIALRREGKTAWDAADEVGVGTTTAHKYERWFELAEGRQPGPALVRDGRRPALIADEVRAIRG